MCVTLTVSLISFIFFHSEFEQALDLSPCQTAAQIAVVSVVGASFNKWKLKPQLVTESVTPQLGVLK